MKFYDRYDSARPYIAAYVLLQKDGKFAAVLRKNTGFMDGYYSLPAGKIEYGEPYKLGAQREAKEEAGVEIALDDLEFSHVCHRHTQRDDQFSDWVDVYFTAKAWQGEVTNAEPEKCEEIAWLDLHNLPENVIPYIAQALHQIEIGQPYSEFGWSDAA